LVIPIYFVRRNSGRPERVIGPEAEAIPVARCLSTKSPSLSHITATCSYHFLALRAMRTFMVESTLTRQRQTELGYIRVSYWTVMQPETLLINSKMPGHSRCALSFQGQVIVTAMTAEIPRKVMEWMARKDIGDGDACLVRFTQRPRLPEASNGWRVRVAFVPANLDLSCRWGIKIRARSTSSLFNSSTQVSAFDSTIYMGLGIRMCQGSQEQGAAFPYSLTEATGHNLYPFAS
jgi:hypothetical protein